MGNKAVGYSQVENLRRLRLVLYYLDMLAYCHDMDAYDEDLTLAVDDRFYVAFEGMKILSSEDPRFREFTRLLYEFVSYVQVEGEEIFLVDLPSVSLLREVCAFLLFRVAGSEFLDEKGNYQGLAAIWRNDLPEDARGGYDVFRDFMSEDEDSTGFQVVLWLLNSLDLRVTEQESEFTVFKVAVMNDKLN